MPRLLALACLLLVFEALPVAARTEPASSTSFEPARITESLRAELERMPFELDGRPPLAVRCSVVVYANGSLDDARCYDDAEHGWLARRVGRRIARTLIAEAFLPARIDGVAVRVRADFAIVLFEADGRTHLRYRAHHGFNVVELESARYSAPQRVQGAPLGCDIARGGAMAVARISATGEASDIEIAGERITAGCRDRIRTALRRSRYVPAFLEGEAVAAEYVELLPAGRL